jgi:hypothetical protein
MRQVTPNLLSGFEFPVRQEYIAGGYRKIVSRFCFEPFVSH